MPVTSPWPGTPRVGVEIELLAPPGRSRLDLARVLAGPDGEVRPVLHPDSEPSLVPGRPVFQNLTLGFDAYDVAGRHVAHLVDDLTLQDDLDRNAPPREGWWRIVGDDRRLLHLARRHGSASDGVLGVLEPLAALFGTGVQALEGGVYRVQDEDGMPVALGAPLPGERERPCELVTPPLGPFATDAELVEALDALLGPARDMGFTVPAEAAVHLHLDAAPLHETRTFAWLVETLTAIGPDLRRALGTNPLNRRLGAWPDALLQHVRDPSFLELSWPAARERLKTIGITKYTDFNLRNVVHDIPGKPTFEVRILPGTIEGADVVRGLRLVLDALGRAQA